MTPDEIIQQYMGLAKMLAKERADPHAPNDLEELISAAYFGLVQVAQAGNPDIAYVAARIKGAIHDAMRNNDILSRRDRAILKAMKKFGDDAEAAAHSLDLPVGLVEQRMAALHAWVDSSHKRRESSYTPDTFNETLEVLLNGLPNHLHPVFLAFYVEGRNRKDIAKHLQIHRPIVTEHLQEIESILADHRETLAKLLL